MPRLSQLCWLYCSDQWTIFKMAAVTVSVQQIKCLQQTFTSNIMDDACSDTSTLKSTNRMLFCVFADSFLIRTCLGILFFQSLSSHSLIHLYTPFTLFRHHRVSFHCFLFFHFYSYCCFLYPSAFVWVLLLAPPHFLSKPMEMFLCTCTVSVFRRMLSWLRNAWLGFVWAASCLSLCRRCGRDLFFLSCCIIESTTHDLILFDFTQTFKEKS